MNETLQHLPPLRDREGFSSAVTSHSNTVEVEGVTFQILEMEDVLFHLDSAVMMPENPQGRSSAQGTPDEPAGSPNSTANATGVAALGLVFRQLEFDPTKRVLLSAHADTSGQADYNFTLSNERGRNVLFLLSGDSAAWSANCAARHKIEDYQQVMTFVKDRLGWNCDPQGIDNRWGPNTESACESFFRRAYSEFDGLPDANAAQRARSLLSTVKRDAAKKWTTEAWRLAWNIYERQLVQALGSNDADMRQRRSLLQSRWVDAARPIVACGEAWPIDAPQRGNYRSQQNRRVEILFFDEGEIDPAGLEQCTLRTGQPRGASQVSDAYRRLCPIWAYRQFFLPLYIDPADLNAILCHIKFTYFDRVKQRTEALPAIPGLSIRAFERSGTAPETMTEFPTVTMYRNGVYYVKVRYPDAPSNHQRGNLHFEFATANQWVYTANNEATPEIRTVTPVDFSALTPLERFRHYDVPPQWDSRNWQCALGATTDRFENLVQRVTTAAEPLVFNLDTIVLVEESGGTQTQAVQDEDHQIPAVRKALDPNRSRIKLFFVDATSGRLQLYRSGDDGPSSRILFSRNYITPPTNNVVIVFFRDGFYTVGRRRSAPQANWVANAMVVGARAALRNDADCHVTMEMYNVPAEFRSTGDYELNYFHHLFHDGVHPVSYLISYVSISFMADTRTNTHAPIPSAADVQHYVDTGIYNCIDHWNRKQYWYEEENVADGTTTIYPFYFFDERETFLVTPPAGGFNIDFDQRSNHAALFSHEAIVAAQRNAYGGRSRFLAMVCRDENGHWGPAYHWSIRNEGPQHYSLFKLNKSGGDNYADMFPPRVPVNEHGDSFGALTFAHELGHATGQQDEYINRTYQPDVGNALRFPGFGQHFVAYSMAANETSMMYHNAAPRLHHCWYPLHRLNQGISVVPLSNMLGGKKFVARLNRGADWNYTYTRFLNATDAAHFQKPRVLTQPMFSAAQHQLSAAPLKRISLAIHDVGRDESSVRNFHAAQNIEYQAVVVVRILMGVQFVGGGWTGAHRRQRIREIDAEWDLWRGHYRLINGPRDITCAYVHFMPGFSDDAANANRNYLLRLSRDPHPGTGDRIPNDAGTLTIYRDVPADEIMRYMLHTNSARGTAAALERVRAWVNTEMGASFIVQVF